MLSSRALSIPTSIPNGITSLVGEPARQAMQFPASGRPPRSADPRPPQGSVTPLRSVPFSIAESAPFSIAVDNDFEILRKPAQSAQNVRLKNINRFDN